MKDQVHIRNAEAARLARALARQTGRTINEVVLDALRQYRPGAPAPSPAQELVYGRELLRRDQIAFAGREEIPLEDLYDPDTGLPSDRP